MRENVDDLKAELEKSKLAEEALRESEEKFSRAFMAVPNLLIVATLPQERYVDVNEAFERTCGWRRDEVYGCTLAEIDIWKNPADRSKLIGILQQERRVRDLEIEFRNRAGDTFIGLLSAELIELCGITCMIAIITDITERKRAEEALRRSEEKFAKVFRYVPSLLVVSSTLKEGRMIEFNASFEKVFKYTREEAIGRSETASERFRRSGRRGKCETGRSSLWTSTAKFSSGFTRPLSSKSKGKTVCSAS
jgi:PAS domain S-box-containing protein